MSGMVERLARVLCESAGWNPDEPVVMLSKPNGKGLRWEFHVPAARSVIEAMREPTEAMQAATEGNGPYLDWQAMIDEALK